MSPTEGICREITRLRDYCTEFGMELAIITGGARGVDTTARAMATQNRIQVIDVPAMWDYPHLLKSAGFYRNELMVQLAEEVVVWWDGKSNGTRNTITLAESMGKEVVVYYDNK